MAESGDNTFVMTEAEKKIRNARRERSNRISSIMGQYLLKSYTMLNETCNACDTILLRNRQGDYHCVGCMDVDNDTSKDDPAVNSHAAISHLQEMQSTSSKSNVQVTEDVNPKCTSTIETLEYARQIIENKLRTTSTLLNESSDHDLSIKLTKLIQILSETLGSLDAIRK